MIKTAIVLFTLLMIAGFVILRAVRAMKSQIAADAADRDDWAGAKRFGGRYGGDTGEASLPPEAEIRRSWTPVRAPTAGALARPAADGEVGRLSEAHLRKYVKWCDAHCKAGWLIVLPVAGAATLWFQDPLDAQRFARAWHPLAGT